MKELTKKTFGTVDFYLTEGGELERSVVYPYSREDDSVLITPDRINTIALYLGLRFELEDGHPYKSSLGLLDRLRKLGSKWDAVTCENQKNFWLRIEALSVFIPSENMRIVYSDLETAFSQCGINTESFLMLTEDDKDLL